jgi:hypothetical protein
VLVTRPNTFPVGPFDLPMPDCLPDKVSSPGEALLASEGDSFDFADGYELSRSRTVGLDDRNVSKVRKCSFRVH